MNQRMRPLVYQLTRQGAFTLIEVMIVVTIMGLLIVAGMFSFASAAARSRDNARKADLSRIKNVLQQHYADFRLYPTLDRPAGAPNPIFSASWQLANTHDGQALACGHTTTNARLEPRLITAIPTDPRDSLALNSANCAQLAANQGQRYLYIVPTTATGPSATPTAFGLMATLERPNDSDVEFLKADGSNNPLRKNSLSPWGPWYFDNFPNAYGSPGLGVNANYFVTNIGL